MKSSEGARLVNLLGAVATGLADQVQDTARELAGIGGNDPSALIALLDFSPHGTVKTLSQICGLTHSGTVRLVNRLARIGYVIRSPGQDARSVTVTLTPVGTEVALALRAARHAAIAATIEDLSQHQREHLTTACETLVRALVGQRLERRATGGTPVGGALCRLCDFGACQRAEGRCPAAPPDLADNRYR